MIGDEIEVSVLGVSGEKVRLGIEAPKSVPVFRKEVYVDIQDGRREDQGTRRGVDQELDRLKSGE